MAHDEKLIQIMLKPKALISAIRASRENMPRWFADTAADLAYMFMIFGMIFGAVLGVQVLMLLLVLAFQWVMSLYP